MEQIFERPAGARHLSAGEAYWNHRREIADRRERFVALAKAVNRESDLSLYQWAQLFAIALELQPDLIVELGRSHGNSTCAFLEAAGAIGPATCRVVSLCLSDDWVRLTRDRVSRVVPQKWFDPLDARICDIRTADHPTLLSTARRCLLFWDAHGFKVAECVLARVMPLLAERVHLVIMHDLSDARYGSPSDNYYGDKGLWKGNDWSGPRLRLGHIDSAVEQAVAIVDFASRNDIHLHSADKSIRDVIGMDATKEAEMRERLGPDMFSFSAHWYYFSLNERAGTFTFPRWTPTPRPAGESE